MRWVVAALTLGACAVFPAVAADDAATFLRMFEATCAKKPVSAEALDALARPFGYVAGSGAVPPDDPKRDPDDIYSAKLRDQGENFGISAYFGGKRAHYQVSCTVKAVDIDGAAIVETFRHETALPEPRTATDADTGKRTFVWSADADKLELALFKNGRVSATFNYDVVSR